MKKIGIVLLAIVLVASCRKNSTDKSINIFTIEDDKALGAQLDSTILASPAEYNIMSRSAYPEAYAFVENMKDEILNSGEVFYKDDFDWKLTLIDNDTTLNAFCAPGGYIYVYTGLMKYLEHENELAGVMAHEIAHADRRHSTDQLTKNYALSTLLQVLVGKQQGLLTEMAASLISLKFSRNDEAEADDYSVIYMCPTDYKADGAAGFFEKLIENEQAGGSPEFLSTHPDPANRVEDIKAKRNELACEGTGIYSERYQNFLNTLP